MTVTLGESNIVSMEVLKGKQNKNDLVFDIAPKFQKEYIASIATEPPAVKNILRQPTFQRAIRLTILIGQCFGLNPVLGIWENDASKLRFVIYSRRCIYTILSVLGQSWLVFLCALKLLQDSRSTVSSSTSFIFLGTNCLITVCFLRIAMKWPQLSQHIAKLESTDPNEDQRLVKRCNVSCIVILTLAALEHILSAISGIAIAIDCQPNTNLYEAFILQSFPWLWSNLSYSPFLGILTQFFNIQCTFNWNFSDTFVICISWYLISRLKQINQRIVKVRGKHVPVSFWRTMREDYCKATNLVRKVDEVISGIIFISFANNLFFICLQFLHIVEPMRGLEQAVYHVFSFSFLIARSLAVSLIAARVHTASKLPAQTLYEVPTTCFCVEVQRFIDQVNGDTVALSGLQFFNVKRGLVLTIAGTIVTYELVLMQFTGVSPTAAALPNDPVFPTTTSSIST